MKFFVQMASDNKKKYFDILELKSCPTWVKQTKK